MNEIVLEQCPERAGRQPMIDLRGLLKRIRRRLQLARERRALARLDDRLLCDIGVSPEAARQEAEKSFWQD